MFKQINARDEIVKACRLSGTMIFIECIEKQRKRKEWKKRRSSLLRCLQINMKCICMSVLYDVISNFPSIVMYSDESNNSYLFVIQTRNIYVTWHSCLPFKFIAWIDFCAFFFSFPSLFSFVYCRFSSLLFVALNRRKNTVNWMCCSVVGSHKYSVPKPQRRQS